MDRKWNLEIKHIKPQHMKHECDGGGDGGGDNDDDDVDNDMNRAVLV